MMMQNTIISPIQKSIERAFMKIAKVNGNEEVLTLNKYIIYDDGHNINDMSGVQKVKII